MRDDIYILILNKNITNPTFFVQSILGWKVVGINFQLHRTLRDDTPYYWYTVGEFQSSMNQKCFVLFIYCSSVSLVVGIAAQEGHELCVVALLEHGADPNHSDACGRNALRVAAKSGHRGVVRLLEEYNARSHKIAHTSSSANSITSGI